SRSGSLTISGQTVTGSVTGGGFCGNSKTYQIFFRMEFDRAPSSVGTWNGSTVTNGGTSTTGANSGGWLNFDTSSNAVVQLRVEFDRAPSSVGTWNGSTVTNGGTSTTGANSGGWLNFDTSSNAVVQLRV